MIELVCSLELVDETWYAQTIGLDGERSPLAHFLHKGWPSKHAPNPFFDPGWYCDTYNDVVAAQLDPLSHYLEYGENEGRWPCRILDPAWYAKTHGLKLGGGVILAHYLRHGASQGLKPSSIFDPYICSTNNPDGPADLRQAAIHYATIGFRELGNQSNADVAPAYLNATARAVVGPAGAKAHLLLVGHDAHEHGAQMTLLNLGRTFVGRFGLKVTFLLLDSGNLVSRYRELGTVVVTSPHGPDLGAIIEKLGDQGVQLAITNTVVTGCVVSHLKRQGIRVVSLVHELPQLIREFSVEESSRAIARESDVVVFAAEYVRNAFEAELALVANRHTIIPQGLYAKIDPEPNARAAVRSELGIPADARIVLGVGYGNLRKGIDIFFDTAIAAADSKPALVFVWVGRLERATATWLLKFDGASELPANVRLVPFTPAISRYLQAADVYYLTSREDPFPSTVLEALACGLPVVGFAGCTGMEALIGRFGTMVPSYDKGEALDALTSEITRQTAERSAARQAVVAADFLWEDYAFRLLQELNPAWRRISVVVPNYNYARYLGERLESIFLQTVPVYEVIVLDDASSDGSPAVTEQLAHHHGRDIRLVVNAKNSCSVMRQWARGAREASGELVWIAEADDIADSKFLEKLAAISSPRTLMAFSNSTPIDDYGEPLECSYNSYLRRFHGDAFEMSFNCDAAPFATRFLATANIILNVSAVLFRREALLGVLDNELDDLATYRFAGDWLTYLSICRQPGEVAYCARTLNKHRRHGESAVHRTALAAHLAEIARVHAAFGRLFETTPKVLASQRTYRAELHTQFGLEQKEPVEEPRQRSSQRESVGTARFPDAPRG